MRVLITGSSGQIGTNLALRLLEVGHDVLGVDISAAMACFMIRWQGSPVATLITRILLRRSGKSIH